MWKFWKKIKSSFITKKKNDRDRKMEETFREENAVKMMNRDLDKDLFNPIKHG